MATPLDPDFRARLNALNDKYAAGVPALMADIAQALEACRQQGPQTGNLAQLQKMLHTVAGSAATFGFAVLGQWCRELEQAVRVLGIEVAQAPDAGVAVWPALEADLGELLRWAAVDPKAARGTPAV